VKRPLQLDLWLCVVIASFALLVWANWGKLENPIIDIGREVEISARLADGQFLYRDVATYYTPLGYYANALALLLFGHHLEVFYIVNLLLALVATLLFYRLAKRLMNPLWATLCSICMLIYCAIGPGPFNFIMPYSHGAVYAIVFSLVAITCLDYYCTSQKQLRWLVAAGITCGLAGLAKQEYGVAVLGGVLIGVNVQTDKTLRSRLKQSILVALVASICVIVPLSIYAQQVSWEQLFSSLFPTSQIGAINRGTVSLSRTLSVWWSTLKVFIVASSLILGSLVVAHRLSNFVKVPKKFRSLAEGLLSLAFSLLALYLLNRSSIFSNYNYYPPNASFNPLEDLSWALPLLVGWFSLARKQLSLSKHAPLLSALLVFSLILNARWGFYINFYGLYALPVIILFFTLLYNIPQRFKRVVCHYLVICLVISGTFKLGGLLIRYPHAVHSSSGSFYVKNASLAQALNQTVAAIDAAKVSSVLILPEGNILNFMTATHSPSRELTFLPHVLPTARDEQAFIADMQMHRPELIVYVPRPFAEWGYQTYTDFNPLVDHWITQQHRLVHSFPIDSSKIRIYVSK